MGRCIPIHILQTNILALGRDTYGRAYSFCQYWYEATNSNIFIARGMVILGI